MAQAAGWPTLDFSSHRDLRILGSNPRRLRAQDGVGWKILSPSPSPSPPLPPSCARMRALSLSNKYSGRERNLRVPSTSWGRTLHPRPGPASREARLWNPQGPPQESVLLAVRVERGTLGGKHDGEKALRRARVPQADWEEDGNPKPKAGYLLGSEAQDCRKVRRLSAGAKHPAPAVARGGHLLWQARRVALRREDAAGQLLWDVLMSCGDRAGAANGNFGTINDNVTSFVPTGQVGSWDIWGV